MTNLLDNALKFTPRGGQIEVRGHSHDKHVVIEVENDGVGIPPEDIVHLFERYWHRIDRKTFKKSNGLGLFLCKQIVDAHQGKIECESEVGKVTVFRLILPIKTGIEHLNAAKRQELTAQTRGKQ